MKGFTLTLFLSLFRFHESYRILAVLPHVGKSHFVGMELYLEELVTRGHQVVVVSHFPRARHIPNYTDIDIRGTAALPSTGVINLEEIKDMNQFGAVKYLSDLGVKVCENTIKLPQVRQLLNSEEKFDLFIGELFNIDCTLVFAHLLKTSVVMYSASTLMPWANSRVGNPENPSYIPLNYFAYSDRMSFGERLYNTLSYVFHKWYYPGAFDAPQDELLRMLIGKELPGTDKLAANTSLIFMNVHFSFSRPRPVVPGVVEIAGIHLKPVNKLPRDIEDYLNGAEHGVIYFSMGSMIRAETLPDEKRDAFLQAFSELPQRVLWKWEGDTLPGQPKNVKIGKWLPQFDILNHPKVRVFLAHGGLLGTIEAVHVGVPMVGIPMYGDQSTNIKMVEAAGMGIRLSYGDITKENVLKALRTVLDDPSYTENAKRTSRAFRDRPMSPMDTAIYWTEYVIRHKGAPHMRTAGADLPLYQYLLLDVIAVLLAGTLIVIFVTYFILRKIFTLICGSNKHKDVHKKRQ